MSAVSPLPAHPSESHPVEWPRDEAEPSRARLLLMLVAAALLPRLIVFPLNENLYGDAVVRTELDAEWAENPHWIAGFSDGACQFGPLHLYLVGLALKLWQKPEHAGRAVSLLFGVLTVLPLFSLTRRYFGWKRAVWACLAFSVWGIHLQVSTTAASEALSVFLLMSVLALFARAIDENRFSSLAAAALVLNLACATRYDAWMFMPLLGGVLLLGDTDRVAAITRAVLFGLLCLPFPLVWMQGNEMLHGDPLYPVRYIEEYHQRWFRDGEAAWGSLLFRLQNLFFWPGAAFFTMTPLLAAFGLWGMVRAVRTKSPARWLVWMAAVPAAYFTFRASVLGSFVPLGRFTVHQVMLVFPFVAVGLEALAGAKPEKRRALAGAAAALAVAFPAWLGWFTHRTEGKWQDSLRPVSPTSTNPPSLMQVADFLEREAAKDGGGVLLDSDPSYRDIQIAFFSGVPEKKLVRLRHERVRAQLANLDLAWLVRMQGGLLDNLPGVEVGRDYVVLAGRRFEDVAGFSAPFRVYRARR